MFEFSLEIAGEKQLSRVFSRFGSRLADMEPALKTLSDRFFEFEKKQFATQGGEGSGGWKPLKPGYKLWKEFKYPGKGILELTGELNTSLTVPDSFGNVNIIESGQMIVGTTIPYVIYHQSKEPRTSNLPRRPPIELSEKEKRKWTSVIHQHIFKQSRI